MQILRRLKVPTGDILVVQGQYGKLEMLSIGDYGKEINLKADFMSLGRTPEPVRHGNLLPLEEKWVITISTQYGCSIWCQFCDVPRVGPGRNATYLDICDQVATGISLHPEISHTKRLNVHFARMGEPTFNFAVIDAAHRMKSELVDIEGWGFHPVVSTMMPRCNVGLAQFIDKWRIFKNEQCQGDAGLQLSINSTDEAERHAMFSGNAHTLQNIGTIMRGQAPQGRKWTLNFAVAGYQIDPDKLLAAGLDPDRFVCKLTPMHKTAACLESGTSTDGDYTTHAPYREHEEALKAAGYDVLVFIASREEDEGRITCGNAILSGTLPRWYEEMELHPK